MNWGLEGRELLRIGNKQREKHIGAEDDVITGYIGKRAKQFHDISGHLDKLEDLVDLAMVRPHDDCGPLLHPAVLDVEDEPVQLGLDAAPVEGELLVVAAVDVVIADHVNSGVLAASRNVDNQAGL